MSRIYSQHIFLFPFTIELGEFDSKDSPGERLKKIHKRLDKSDWEYKPFQITLETDRPENFPYSDDEIWAYNEYTYFYDYIRDTLYTKEKLEELFANDKSHVSIYYERKTFPDDEITYYIKGEIPIQYTLKVDNVSLRIFETGVGILSLTLYNTCYKSFEDVLKINDFGRRIYPQFLGAGGLKSPVDATKGAFLCDKIVFNACGINITEEFNTNEFLNKPGKYANYIEELLKPLNPLDCKSIIDDRMYTLCWHENDQLINNYDSNEKIFNYKKSREWYMFIFVDGKFAGIGNDEMRSKLIKKSTYARFIDDGTIYGITRYSFMCLCGIDKENDFPYKNIRNHMQKMYYQIVVLLLAQRASIIKFNNELEKISLELIDTKTKEKYSETTGVGNKPYDYSLDEVKKLEKLHLRVINFLNRMTYEEITPQEQGIELYQLSLNNMYIPHQLRFLKQRIADLYLTADQILERINLEEEKKRIVIQGQRKELMDKFTLIAAIFVPLTLYATLSKYIKLIIILPNYLNYGIIPEIFFPIWSLIFFLTLFLLFYCLINDDYSEKLGYKTNWFSPLKALTQQFFNLNSKKELHLWKTLLLICSTFLILLSLPSIISVINKILSYLRFTWQLFQ